jgi:hypothetical protein
MNAHVNPATTVPTFIKTIDPAPLSALSEAAEFILCAIRSLAWGASMDSQDVKEPISWALAKIAEAKGEIPS